MLFPQNRESTNTLVAFPFWFFTSVTVAFLVEEKSFGFAKLKTVSVNVKLPKIEIVESLSYRVKQELIPFVFAINKLANVSSNVTICGIVIAPNGRAVVLLGN